MLSSSYAQTNTSLEEIADYAFDHQVPVYHATWAINLKQGGAVAFCSCDICERTGLMTAGLD